MDSILDLDAPLFLRYAFNSSIFPALTKFSASCPVNALALEMEVERSLFVPLRTLGRLLFWGGCGRVGDNDFPCDISNDFDLGNITLD